MCLFVLHILGFCISIREKKSRLYIWFHILVNDTYQNSLQKQEEVLTSILSWIIDSFVSYSFAKSYDDGSRIYDPQHGQGVSQIKFENWQFP